MKRVPEKSPSKIRLINLFLSLSSVLGFLNHFKANSSIQKECERFKCVLCVVSAFDRVISTN